jgi:hypothetical protein
MRDNRRLTRRRTLKGGIISFGQNASLSCMVRNLTSDGVCLEFGSLIGVPDNFTLAIESDPLRRTCNVIWRRENRIGVVFK